MLIIVVEQWCGGARKVGFLLLLCLAGCTPTLPLTLSPTLSSAGEMIKLRMLLPGHVLNGLLTFVGIQCGCWCHHSGCIGRGPSWSSQGWIDGGATNRQFSLNLAIF
jgi:hypothetical protein